MKFWKSEEKQKNYESILYSMDPMGTWRPTFKILLKAAKKYEFEIDRWKASVQGQIERNENLAERQQHLKVISDLSRELEAKSLVYEHLWWAIWNHGAVYGVEEAVHKVFSGVYSPILGQCI